MRRRRFRVLQLSGEFLIVFGCLSLLVFIYALPLQAEDYDEYIKRGDEYYYKFENLKALEEYKRAYQLAPFSFPALMKLTQAYNDVGEDIKGIHFQKSKINGSNSEQVEEYFSKAAQYAELLTQKFPDRAESYFLLAASYGHLALFKGGNDKVRLARNVEKNCKRAIELNPQYTPAYIALGVYYREVAKLSWAERALARALFGGLPRATEEDSRNMLLEALELNPDIIHIHFELAKTYDEMNEPDKVIEELEEIQKLPEVDHMDQEIKTEAEKELKRLAKNNRSE